MSAARIPKEPGSMAPAPTPLDLAQLREDIRRSQAETKGVREELRAGLERLAGTWAEDAKARHDLAQAITKIAETTAKHAEELATMKKKQEDDDHEKTRAKTGIAIFRAAGGFLLTLAIGLGGYLLRSYIEVRDATRDHTAALATMQDRGERLEAAHEATAAEVREHDAAVVEVRTRLGSIDATLGRIEDTLEDTPRRRSPR